MDKSRYLTNTIHEMCFLSSPKMAFIVGPRQSGKTTLARSFIAERDNGAYYNWDQREFRTRWALEPQQLVTASTIRTESTPVIVFDEIHKARLWKRTLKGIFDTLEHRTDIVVTGSARLDTYKKGSDSLLGRYFLFHLHPFSLAEMVGKPPPAPEEALEAITNGPTPASSIHEEFLNDLMRFGGFPEPLFAHSERRANAWRRMRLQQLVREDLRDLSKLPELGNVELLMALLPERAGSKLSRSTLREDIEVAYSTVSRWLTYLSALFYHFELKPYSKSIKRSLKKEGKLYLWDYAEIPDRGHRFENLIASHLLKACDFWTDAGYGRFTLNYLRNADDAEIDFLIVRDGKPWLPIEAKISDTTPSRHWRSLLPQIGCPIGVQVLLEPKQHLSQHALDKKKIVVMDAARFLSRLV